MNDVQTWPCPWCDDGTDPLFEDSRSPCQVCGGSQEITDELVEVSPGVYDYRRLEGPQIGLGIDNNSTASARTPHKPQ